MTLYLLLDATIKASVVLTAALVVTALLHRRSAAVRHWVLVMGVVGALAVPVASVWLPAWNVASALSSAPAPELSSSSSPTRGVSSSTSFRLPGTASTPQGTDVTSKSPIAPSSFVVAWIAGAAVSLAMLGLGLVRLSRLSRGGEPIRDEVWLREAENLRRSYGLTTAPRLIRSTHPTLLVARGWPRAAVIVPASADRWPVDRVRVVLAHEFAHIARADSITLVAMEVLRALQWFNPVTWIVARRLRHESERACDDLVLAGGTDPYSYANHLVDVARELRARPFGLPAPAMAVPSSLERRIVAMMNSSLDRNTPSRSSRAFALATCLLFTVVVSSAQSPSSGISGQVLDETGATLPGVSITVENSSDEIVATAITSVTGQYAVGDLLPGTYSLTAEMPAFRKVVRTDIMVTAAAMAESNITLEVGGLEETVVLSSPQSSNRTVAEDAVQAREAVEQRMAACSSSPPNYGSTVVNGAVRVGGQVRVPRKLVHVTPAYEAALVDQGVAGIVILEATVTTEGFVEDVSVLRDPNAALSQAAADAVSSWEFLPAFLNGCPVPVVMNVTVNFQK